MFVQVVSGQSLAEFFTTELLEPLELHDTGFSVPVEKGHRLSKCYEYDAAHTFKASVSKERERVEPHAPHTLLSGGGGLVSTVDDYLTFTKFLLHKGVHKGRRLLSEESVALMTMNHLPPGTDLASFGCDKSFSESVGHGYGFGYNLSVAINPDTVPGGALSGLGEYGWGGLASTTFFVDPQHDLVVVFLTQLIPSRAYPVRPQLKWLSHWLCRDDLSEDSSA